MLRPGDEVWASWDTRGRRRPAGSARGRPRRSTWKISTSSTNRSDTHELTRPPNRSAGSWPMMSRRRFLGRSGLALGGLALGPSLLAACGGDDGGGGGGRARRRRRGRATSRRRPATRLRISNWPFYIDEETVGLFEEESGLTVTYTEDVNDNEEYFARIREPLEPRPGHRRRPVHRHRLPGEPADRPRAGWLPSTTPTSRTRATWWRRCRASSSTRTGRYSLPVVLGLHVDRLQPAADRPGDHQPRRPLRPRVRRPGHHVQRPAGRPRPGPAHPGRCRPPRPPPRQSRPPWPRCRRPRTPARSGASPATTTATTWWPATWPSPRRTPATSPSCSWTTRTWSSCSPRRG